MGHKTSAYRTLVGRSEGKIAVGVGGKIILNCMLKKWYGKAWTGFI